VAETGHHPDADEKEHAEVDGGDPAASSSEKAKERERRISGTTASRPGMSILGTGRAFARKSRRA
jgi:hypothetical protein